MSFNPPPLPSGDFTPQQFQVWWQQVIDSIGAELGALDTAVAALAAAEEYMADLPAITIAADYTGAVTPPSQLPKTTQAQRFNGTTDVTASSLWSAVARTGGASISIDSGTGALTLSAITANDIVDVTSVRDVAPGYPITITKSQAYNFAAGAPPSGGGGGGGGGSTDTTSTFADISTAVHAVIATLTVEAGAGGIVTLGAPLSTITDEGLSGAGTFKVWGKWEWDSTGGGVWVALAAEVSSSPDCTITFHAGGGGYYTEHNGAISVPDSKTGLTPATSYNFRLLARNDVATPGATMSFAGTASGVGS